MSIRNFSNAFCMTIWVDLMSHILDTGRVFSVQVYVRGDNRPDNDGLL